MPDLIYVYCVTNRMPVLERPASPDAKPASPPADLPDLLVHDGLCAVVGRVPAEDFGEERLTARLNDPTWLTEKVKLHELIVEHAMQFGCVVPLKFGTVFTSEDSVRAMLGAHAVEFRKNLAELTDKREWGVKVYCDRGQLTASVAAQNPTLVELDREIGAAPRGRAFLLTQRRTRLMAAAVNNEVARLGQECFRRLTTRGSKTRANGLWKPDVAGRPEEMILNAAFLVPEDNTRQFFSAVEELREQFEPHGLLFERTGPWPPYNFCEFGRENAQLG